jgi:NAD(P)-dependent dehydrogenase (short-subunit alcohol dehydrogenase family)
MSTVLITGANRGLGLEFARQYARDGWRVIATARDPEKADALRRLGAGVAIHRLDVADFDAIAALGHALGKETIDVLIANAGIMGPRVTPETVDREAEAWLQTLRVNTLAPLALAGAFETQVARSEQRKMVAISSGLGSIGSDTGGGMYAYRSSKAALNAVWHSYAIDHPEIIAVLLSPGWVRTDMGGAGAPLAPDDSIARLRRIIAGLSKADSGRFYAHDGKPIPW